MAVYLKTHHEFVANGRRPIIVRDELFCLPLPMRYILPVNRSDLIDLLNTRFEVLPPKDVELAVSLILDAITQAIVRGDRIEILGFGSFTLRQWSARQAWNPKIGGLIQVPTKCSPQFRFGKELRERVKEAGDDACATSSLLQR